MISHIEQATIRRSHLLNPHLLYTLAADEMVPWPFSLNQRRLTETFPETATTASQNGIALHDYPPGEIVLWRIKGPGPLASGAFTGEEIHELFTGSNPTQGFSVDGSSFLAELEPLVLFPKRNADATVSYEQHVPEAVYLIWDDYGGDVYQRRLRFTLSGFDDVYQSSDRDGAVFETIWEGRSQPYFGTDIGHNLPEDSADVPPLPGSGVKSTLISRFVWPYVKVPLIVDPTPLSHDFEADLGPLGMFTSTSDQGSLTGLFHRDHPQPGDHPQLSLNGADLGSVTSWAVVARADLDGGGLGLLTCDGSVLTGPLAGSDLGRRRGRVAEGSKTPRASPRCHRRAARIRAGGVWPP